MRVFAGALDWESSRPASGAVFVAESSKITARRFITPSFIANVKILRAARFRSHVGGNVSLMLKTYNELAQLGCVFTDASLQSDSLVGRPRVFLIPRFRACK